MSLLKFIIIIAVPLALYYGFIIEPFRVEVSHQFIEADFFGSHLSGKTAIHLTDLHIARFGSYHKKIIKLVNEMEPDFIFLTGDYVKWKGDYEPALQFLSELRANIGIWGVMGDYEAGISRRRCLFCHAPDSKDLTKRHEVKFLVNEIEAVSVGGGTLTIAGLESGSPIQHLWSKYNITVDRGPILLLAHSPLIFCQIDEHLPVLMLAGDTHGGQIPLPPIIWKLLDYEKTAVYEQGFFKQHNKQMYVNRGIGTSHLPVRFLRPPEITVFHFQ